MRERSVAAAMALSICLALAGCKGCSSSPTSQPGSPASTGSLAPMSNPVVAVSGSEAKVDLGPIQPASKHTIVYIVENPSDQPLLIKSIRPDCECVEAVDPPTRIEPKSSAKVTMAYTAPKTAMEYESRLMVLTDNPARKMISLRVKSWPPAKGARPASGPAATTTPPASAPAK